METRLNINMHLINENSVLKRPIALSNLIWVVIVLILLTAEVYLFFLYSTQKQDLRNLQSRMNEQRISAEILNFTKMFVENVLNANGEVNFETRLKLESAVRNLNDEEILSQWQKFINSQTEEDAQNNVKRLLEMLVNKI